MPVAMIALLLVYDSPGTGVLEQGSLQNQYVIIR